MKQIIIWRLHNSHKGSAYKAISEMSAVLDKPCIHHCDNSQTCINFRKYLEIL